jgi:hypothetical protein
VPGAGSHGSGNSQKLRLRLGMVIKPMVIFWEFCRLLVRLQLADWRFRSSLPARWQRCTLKDVPIARVEELLMRWAGGSVWRGGPQAALVGTPCLAAEHFRGKTLASNPALEMGSWQQWPRRRGRLFWCGPIVDHFGHQLGEFGGRVLLASLDPRPGTLLFLHPDPGAGWGQLKSWQRAWINYLNPRRKSVVVCAGGFVAESLVVIPQQQRLGELPTALHWLALSWRSSQIQVRGESEGVREVLVLSRAQHSPALDAGKLRGSVAGEQAFDRIMFQRGAKVLYPEQLSFAEQLRLLHNASTVVIAEGSALHTLELLGYQPEKQVIVIARRPLWPGMEQPLQCRFPKLEWIDAVDELWWLEPANPRVKGLAMLNWQSALGRLGTALGWSFSAAEALSLQKAAREQLECLRGNSQMQMEHCGAEHRQAQRAGGW